MMKTTSHFPGWINPPRQPSFDVPHAAAIQTAERAERVDAQPHPATGTRALAQRVDREVELGKVLAIGALGGAILTAAGAPNPYMFGPLLVSIALNVHGLQFSSIPAWASNLGQLLLGCALGSRFERRFLSGLGRYVAAVLVSVLLAMAAAAALGFLLAWLTGLSAASLMLALAPGGIAEMCITAKVLQLGVPLVTAAHVTRVVILINATGAIYRATTRKT